MKKLPILVGVSFFIFALKQYINAVNYMFNIALGRGNKMFLAKCTDLTTEEKILERDMKKQQQSLKKWVHKTRQAPCYIHGEGNKAIYLKVFLQNSFTDNWVIVVHGYGGCGEMMYYAAKEFYDKGYNVVVPDLAAHGKSGGRFIGMGWCDRLDIVKVINCIVKGNENAHIYLYGVSMGGAAVLMTGGEKLPRNVKGIVADCSYDNVSNILAYQLKKIFNLPAFPFVYTMSRICKKKLGFTFNQASVEKQLEKCKLPLLLFHGEKDELVPAQMAYKLCNHTKGYRDLCVVKNAGHGVSAMVRHNYYWGKVFDFLDRVG